MNFIYTVLGFRVKSAQKHIVLELIQ